MAPLSARCLDELGQAGLLVLLSLVMLGSLHGSAVCAAPTIVCDGETTPARALDVDCGGTQTGAEFVVRDCQLAQINVEYQIEFCTVTIHNTVLHDGGISVATATSVPNPAGLRLNMTNITVEAVPEGRPIPIRSDKGGWPYGHIFDGCTGCSITLDGFRSSNASLIETYNLDQALSNSVGSTLVVRNVGTEAVPASHLAYEACTNAVRASIEVSHVVAAGAAFAYLGRSSVDSVLAVSDVFGALSRRGQKGQHDNAFFGMLANSNGAAMVARHIVHRAEHENFFKYLCENCTHGRVLIEHVSSPDAWNAAPTENHVYRYMGRGSSHFSFAIRHVTNIRDAFNNICQSASHCTGEVSDVSDMFLSFGLAAAKLGPEPRAVNVTIDYSDIRRVNGAMSLGGYMSLDSAFRYRNIRHAINFTMSMACMLGENCRMEASGIEDSDEILAVLGQSSKNSRCVLRDLHNVSRIFAKPTKQMKFAGLGTVCEPGSKNSGACEQFIDAVFDVIPSSGSEIYLRNATLNPSGDHGFSYLARNGVGGVIDMDDVRFAPSARSAPLIMFEDAWKGSGVLKPCENLLYSVMRLLMDDVFGSQCDFVGASVMRFGPDFDWSTMPFKTAFAAAGELSVNATLDLSRSADYGCDLFDGTTRMSTTAFTSNAQTPKVILNASLCTDPLNILSLYGFGFFMAPVARAHFSLIDVAPRPASSPIKRFAIANVGLFELTTDKFRTGQVSVLELSITDTDMTDLDAIIEAFGPAVGRQLRFVDARRNRLTGPAIRRVVMSMGQSVNVAANGASGASIAISDLAAIAGSPATTTSGAPREVVIGEFSMAAVVQGKLNVGIGIEAECLTTSANVIVRYWTVKQNGSYPLSVASAGPFNASEALCRGCVPGEPIDLAQPCRSRTLRPSGTGSATQVPPTPTMTLSPTPRLSRTSSPARTASPGRSWSKTATPSAASVSASSSNDVAPASIFRAEIIAGTPARVASATAAAATGVSGSASGAVFAARITTLSTLASCGADPSQQPIDRTANPLGLRVGNGRLQIEAGALVGGIALLGGVTCLLLAVVGARLAPSGMSPPPSSPPRTAATLRALAVARFPSALAVPFVLFGPAVLQASLAVAAFGTAISLRGIAVVFIAAYCAGVLWTVRLLTSPRMFLAEFEPLRPARRVHNPSCRARFVAGLECVLAPYGEWRDRRHARGLKFVKRHLLFFGDYQAGSHAFLLFELSLSTALAAIGAASLAPRTSGCGVIGGVAAALMLTHTATVVILRPHESPLGFLANVLMSGTQTASGIVAAVSASGMIEDSVALDDAALWVAYAGVGANVLLTAHGLSRFAHGIVLKHARRLASKFSAQAVSNNQRGDDFSAPPWFLEITGAEQPLLDDDSTPDEDAETMVRVTASAAIPGPDVSVLVVPVCAADAREQRKAARRTRVERRALRAARNAGAPDPGSECGAERGSDQATSTTPMNALVNSQQPGRLLNDPAYVAHRAKAAAEAAKLHKRRAFLRWMAGGADVVVDSFGEPLIQPDVHYDTSLPSSVVPPRHWVTIPPRESAARPAIDL